MTGTDPAVEAAQRAWAAFDPTRTERNTTVLLQVAAAREALQPIRDRHRPFTRDFPGGDGRTVCTYCLGPRDWPCLDARDAYPSEELSQ